jgi:hypothetical protein
MALPAAGFKITLGWREWVSLPDLGIPAIKAKLDTGARTSSLHAFKVEPFRSGGRLKVRFGIHPLQRRGDIEIFSSAEVIDRRYVIDSGGHRELRYVIQTPIHIGQRSWDVEIGLTNRDIMRFRMLLGRTAMQGRMLVDPQGSYLTGRALMRAYRKGRKRRSKKNENRDPLA